MIKEILFEATNQLSLLPLGIPVPLKETVQSVECLYLHLSSGFSLAASPYFRMGKTKQISRKVIPVCMHSWMHIPSDPLKLIFAYLPPKDILSCLDVCKRWRRLLLEQQPVCKAYFHYIERANVPIGNRFRLRLAITSTVAPAILSIIIAVGVHLLCSLVSTVDIAKSQIPNLIMLTVFYLHALYYVSRFAYYYFSSVGTEEVKKQIKKEVRLPASLSRDPAIKDYLHPQTKMILTLPIEHRQTHALEDLASLVKDPITLTIQWPSGTHAGDFIGRPDIFRAIRRHWFKP